MGARDADPRLCAPDGCAAMLLSPSCPAWRRQAARSVSVRAYGPDRPLWFPGNPAPAHLDGT